MPTRFDHAVIYVRDLDTAIKRFQHLGFDVKPGGRHTGRGTYNGLVRFGLDYFELLAVYDVAEARAFAAGKPTLLDALKDREAKLSRFALATTQIDADSQRFTGYGTEKPEPNAMRRILPNGQNLSWRVLSPEGSSQDRPWPFLIQWNTPDEQRLQIDVPGNHPNGVTGWVRVLVATNDLERTRDIYQNQLGLELISADTIPDQAASRVTFRLGKGTIEILASTGDGPVQHILSDKGEGPFALYFSVRNLRETQRFFEQNGIAFTYETADEEKLVIAPSEVFGVHINLVG
jgi:catechol 2,3-dioxygenase-like lactoylglutathione lyase family enzyme